MRIAAVEAFKAVEKSLKELKTQLSQFQSERKSIMATLEGAERQAETQRKQLHQVELDLAAAREQNKILMKKLEEAERAKD